MIVLVIHRTPLSRNEDETHDMSIIILVFHKTLSGLVLLLSLVVFPKIYKICKKGSFISDLLRGWGPFKKTENVSF